jgi:hypothetical protein
LDISLIDHYETLLREKLDQSDMPFLGLFIDVLDESITEELRNLTQSSQNPIETYCMHLSSQPALFATNLINYLATEFGAHGYFEVYPFLKYAIGKDLTNRQKELLWRFFRRACLKIGLQVSSRHSGTHYMVDEYLRQVGAPLRYIPDLTKQMINYGKYAGFPDEDDPAAINLWRKGLVERLTPKTLKKAVDLDEANYYSRIFLKLLDSTLDYHPETEIEKQMFLTIHQAGQETTKRQRVLIPQIVLRDFTIGVLLPGGEEFKQNKWFVEVGAEGYYYNVQSDEQFIPVDQKLPQHITVMDNEFEIKKTYPIWIDNQTNRLLVFSEKTGLFMKNVSLTDKEVFLEPGEYRILLRFEPEDTTEPFEQISVEPELFLQTVTLNPGESFFIKRGPAVLYLKAENVALLKWYGNYVKGIRGNEIYQAQGLSLRIILPEEILESSETGFIVQLNPGLLGDTIEIPMQQFESNQIEISLDHHCTKWKPGLCRFLVELRRLNSKRIITRNAIYLWNGLSEVKDKTRFYCDHLPSFDNLRKELSDNIDIRDDQKLITYKNEANRTFRMVFALGNNRTVAFTWAVPGIFLYLEDYANSGAVTERTIRKGTVIAVTPSSRKVLKIHTTESGKLQMGGFDRSFNSSQIGYISIHLSSMLEYLRPGENTLYFINNKEMVALVSLVSPHQVLKFIISKDLLLITCNFFLTERIDKFRITARDVISGNVTSLDMMPYSPVEEVGLGGSTWFECSFDENSSSYNHSINLYLGNWEQGAWLLDFQVNSSGRWEVLVNDRQDLYSVGFILREKGKIGQVSDLYPLIESLTEPEQISCFKRVHEALLKCYDKYVWNEISWLNKLWKRMSGLFFFPRELFL